MKLIIALCLSAAPALAQPPDPSLLDRYFQQGEQALAAGRYQEAAEAYEKLGALSPATAEVHAKLGLVYFQLRSYERAVAALRQALKLKPGLPKADVLLAMSLSELGRFREAVPGLQKGFRQTADSWLRRMCGLQLQRAYTGLQQDDKAVEVALELTRLHPEDPEVLYHSSRLFSNYAYLTTMKLAQVAPTSVWMHQAAGEANESQGLYEPAIREYREVLTLDPRRPGIHFRIGRTLLARAQASGEAPAASSRTEAVKEFEEELALDPTNASAAYELGEAHRRSGELDEARRFFEAAVDHYPDFEQAHLALGRVLLAAGKPEPALVHLRKAIAINPENAVSYYQLSRAHQALGNAVGQQEALAKFQALRAQEQKRTETALLPLQVTKQDLDPNAPPPQP